jgi:hypothetical protein
MDSTNANICRLGALFVDLILLSFVARVKYLVAVVHQPEDIFL